MTLPRSSRRRSLNAALAVDDEVETRSAAPQSSSLYNRGSELSPVVSFSPNVPESRKFFTMQNESIRSAPPPPDVECGAFMQGAHDNSPIVDLSAVQMGVLLTFAPPAASSVMDAHALNKIRKAMSLLVKILVDEESAILREGSSSTAFSYILVHRYLESKGIERRRGRRLL